MPLVALKFIFLVVLVGQSTFCFAHTYFFGLTELSVNPNNQSIEVIHQFTAHDIENAIAENKQEHFSPEHPSYETYLKTYIQKNFALHHNKHNIKLHWIGFELIKGKLFFYQEASYKKNLVGLVVKNSILTDTYPKQTNTLNYQDTVIIGSLTFTESLKVATIKKK
jgi:hypothetical protein